MIGLDGMYGIWMVVIGHRSSIYTYINVSIGFLFFAEWWPFTWLRDMQSKHRQKPVCTI